MKFGIEVIGQKCKPRPEDRLLDSPSFTPLTSPVRTPTTPDTITEEEMRSVYINGYDAHIDRHLVLSGRSRRRPATVGPYGTGTSHAMAGACPVWAHSSLPGKHGFLSSARRRGDSSISAAQFEKGKKVVISYYDKRGRTISMPKSVEAIRSSVSKRKKGPVDPNNNHVSESESTVSITSITNRLYNRSGYGSALERAFTSDLSQSTPSLDSSPEEELHTGTSSDMSSPSAKVSSASTSMPSIHRSQPFLVSARSSAKDTASEGTPTNSSDDQSSRTTQPYLRAAASSPGKRVHFSVDDSVKDRMRTVYATRRTNSVIGGKFNGANGGPDSVAKGRGRTRRKTTIEAPVFDGTPRGDRAPRSASKLYRKFRLVGHIVACLVKLQAAIEVNSQDQTVRSASEIQWRTLYGEQESEKLAFNKSLFSRERVSTKMPRWALGILDIPPESRSEQDCRRLHALFRNMRSFGKFTEQIQLSLCRAFSYTCVGESRIVLRRGHIGHNFYFIYSGSVFVNVQDVDSDGNTFIKTEATLGSGDSFGELALLQDIRRTATISVRETCELLVVEKDVFAKVCPKIFEKELMEKQTFISRLPLFSSKWWTPESLRALCMEAQIQEYKINKIVVNDSAIEDWLYICMEGKCQVIRCLSLEGGEEEEVPRQRSREPSVVLSEEIIELLAKAAVGPTKEESELDHDTHSERENSKMKLLSSLGLEYVHTGKRRGAFIEEMEVEERRKALLATSGPMTLTSLMAQQQREGKTGLVYLNVGSLEAEGVFDMGSLIRMPLKRSSSSLLLVSSGARMLRIKKKTFFELATPQALEHTRTLASKEPIPSEAALLESYKKKVHWDNYKHGVVQEVMRSKELRAAPVHRDTSTKTQLDVDAASSWLERSQTSTRLLSALHRYNGVDRKGPKRQGRGHSPGQNDLDLQGQDLEGQDHSDPEDESQAESGRQGEEHAVTVENTSKEEGEWKQESETGAPIFPVIQVENDPSKPEDTPRSDYSAPRRPLGALTEVEEDAKRPSAVIVRRRSSVGVNNRPNVSGETAFVMRRRTSTSSPPRVSLIVETDSPSGH